MRRVKPCDSTAPATVSSSMSDSTVSNWTRRAGSTTTCPSGALLTELAPDNPRVPTVWCSASTTTSRPGRQSSTAMCASRVCKPGCIPGLSAAQSGSTGFATDSSCAPLSRARHCGCSARASSTSPCAPHLTPERSPRLVDRTRFFVDDELVAESAQRPAYPLQIMLNLYELPDESQRLASEFPLEAHVTSIREWHPR